MQFSGRIVGRAGQSAADGRQRQSASTAAQAAFFVLWIKSGKIGHVASLHAITCREANSDNATLADDWRGVSFSREEVQDGTRIERCWRVSRRREVRSGVSSKQWRIYFRPGYNARLTIHKEEMR